MIFLSCRLSPILATLTRQTMFLPPLRRQGNSIL